MVNPHVRNLAVTMLLFYYYFRKQLLDERIYSTSTIIEFSKLCELGHRAFIANLLHITISISI